MKYNIILYTGENGVVGSAPQGRHGTTKTFIYLEVQYNIEDKKTDGMETTCKGH